MDGTCNTHRGNEKCIQNLSENLKGRDDLENLGADRSIILKWVIKKQVWLGIWHSCRLL
jgi:hypothetical protein